LPNPFDTRVFYIISPPASRPDQHVAMMWSLDESKRAADGLAALQLARAEVRELRATLFGTVRAPGRLPSWIRYVRSPYCGFRAIPYTRSDRIRTPIPTFSYTR
jgi:hypothetical protein